MTLEIDPAEEAVMSSLLRMVRRMRGMSLHNLGHFLESCDSKWGGTVTLSADKGTGPIECRYRSGDPS